MKAEPKPKPGIQAQAGNGWLQWMQNGFAVMLGLFLGVALVKFGNPVVMEKYSTRPTNIYEFLFASWPAAWGYGLCVVVFLIGMVVAAVVIRRQLAVGWRPGRLWWIGVIPLVWLAWQILAATRSIDPLASRATVIHFATCVACFYLGLLSIGWGRQMGWLWIGVLGGLAWVLVSGFQQHFGGLEESRRYFFTYIYPNLEVPPPPEYLKKITSSRIFATLFYPNSLAGVILLLLPGSLGVIWSRREQFTPGARGFLMGIVGLASLACLYWSGSKGGWLLMLVIVFVGALILPLKRQFKLALIVSVLVLGLAGFFVKYSGFFKKGATSVVARFDYWQAALRTTRENPVLGTGPGTFGQSYAKIKRPESEMAQIAHNDYLQQASDSGIVGFLLYAGLIAVCLAVACKPNQLSQNSIRLGIWLGTLGWALQSLVEFGLYIPALAWPAFCFMGWLVGTSVETNRQESASSLGSPPQK
jgi:O-antigen ligase